MSGPGQTEVDAHGEAHRDGRAKQVLHARKKTHKHT